MKFREWGFFVLTKIGYFCFSKKIIPHNSYGCKD